MTNDPIPSALQAHKTIKPLIFTKNAKEFNGFIQKVFDAKEIKAARTLDDDGLLLNSEFRIGDSTVIVVDTKEEWPFTPSLLQVYVDDTEGTLCTAKELGATIITEPTEFYGDIFTRFQDPWNNLWWIYQYGDNSSWDDATTDSGNSWSSETDPETLKNLKYIYDTLIEAMKKLGSS